MRQLSVVRRIALIVALSSLAGVAQAQSQRVAGTVVDSATSLPIVAAQIQIVELHRAMQTHQDGAFAFEAVPPGTYTLTIQRLGYRAQERRFVLTSERPESFRIALAQAAIELARRVVTGSLSSRPSDEVLSPTSQLSGASLDRKLDATLAATLLSQPGVATTSISPSTARPVIRGLGGDRIVVLEDGQRPGDLSAMSGDHAVTIDPLTADRVEVVRGAMSLLYGSSALGGVVNVVRDEIPESRVEGLHATLLMQGASVNRGGSIGGHLQGGRGRLAFRVEGSGRSAGDTRTPAAKLVNTGVEELTFAGAASLVGTPGHLGGSYRFYANDYGIPGGFIGGHDRGVDISMRRHAFRADADLHRDDARINHLTATMVATDYGHTEFEPSGAVGTRFDQLMYAGDVVARHDQIGPFTQGAFGTRVQLRDIATGGTLSTPSTQDQSAAAFIVEELSAGPLRFQGGARYEWAHVAPKEETFIDVGGQRIPTRPRTFGALAGSLGVLYEARDGVRVGASLSRAFRTPDITELYSNGPHLAANSFDVGDPTLRSETGLGVDLFARVTRGDFNGEIAAFYNSLRDFIFQSSRGRAELGTQGGRPRFQFTNEDARFVGVEGRVEWSLTRALVADLTASYVQATFTSPRDSLPIITPTSTTFVAASDFPPLIPPLNGSASVRYDRTRWFVGGSARFAAEQSRTGDFESSTSGYIAPSLVGGVRVVRGSQLHAITLRIDNALDAQYRDHLSRIKSIMPEPGRNITLLYRLSF